MTTDIFISNAAGYVPTVNQLERTSAHIGYNRVDAILYGLKVVGGVKTVVVLNFGAEPHEQHDRLHAMNSALDHAAVAEADRGKIPQANAVTGVWELVAMPSAGVTPTDDILYWDSSANNYKPFAAKYSVNPGYPYFYSGDENPTFTANRLNLDAVLYAPGFYTRSSGTGMYSSNIFTAGVFQGTILQSFLDGVHSKYYGTSLTLGESAAQLITSAVDLATGLEISMPLYIGAVASGNMEHISVNDFSKLFDINFTNVRFNKGTASKYLKLNANKIVEYADAPAQYWQRNGTILSPATAGDDINTAGVIKSLNAASSYISSYLGNGAAGVSNLDAYAQQYFQRANTSGSIGANEELTRLFIGGVHSSALKNAINIIATSGNAWSGSSLGASYDILSVANDSISLYSRIKITADGYVVINEDGRPTWLRVEGDTDSHLFEVDGVTDRVGVGTGGSVDTKFHVKTQSDWAQEAVKIQQLDEDQAFIDYVGTSAANTTKNICTMNGGGSLSGPRLNNGVDPGFVYAGMIKIEINGTAYWTPYYSIDTP